MTSKSIIVAVDSLWGIGKDGKLPWHLPEDLANFKKITKNSICIMGYNTYKEIADLFKYEDTRKFLPNRISIVITSRFIPHSGGPYDDFSKNGGMVTAKSITDALNLVSERNDDIFFLGGVGIFNEAIALVDKIYFTSIRENFNCDTTFPIDNLFEHFDRSKYMHEFLPLMDDYQFSNNSELYYKFIEVSK